MNVIVKKLNTCGIKLGSIFLDKQIIIPAYLLTNGIFLKCGCSSRKFTKLATENTSCMKYWLKTLELMINSGCSLQNENCSEPDFKQFELD